MKKKIGISYQTKIGKVLSEATDDKAAITAIIIALELRKKAIDEKIKQLKEELSSS